MTFPPRIPAYRWKTWIFSLVSGAVVVLLFIAIQRIVPSNVPRYNEIVSLVFLLLAVLFLFPARERLHRLVLGRTDYEAMFGGTHHLDFIATHFTIDSIAHEIFPELMAWMGVRAAKLAISDSARKHFVYYLYSEGQPIKERSSYYHSVDELLRFVKHERTPLTPERPLPEEIRKILVRMRAALFFPIFYRNRMVGFLILHEPPTNKYAERALETFAGKAAASIQNSILSARFMDSAAMEREFLVAEKIRKFLQRTDLPTIPGIQINLYENERAPIVVEFFTTPEQRGTAWFLVMFGADRVNGSSAILLSSLLGSLYSFIKKDNQITLHKLLTHFRKNRSTSAFDRIDLCLAEIRSHEDQILAMFDGPGFQVHNPEKPASVLTSSGWRNMIDLKENPTVRFSFGDKPVIQFNRQP